MLKITQSVTVFLLALSVLAGCGAASPAKKDSLSVVIPVDIATLHQWKTNDTWAYNLIGEILDPLWRISPIDGSVYGGLAENWEVNKDFTECKVKLREGVKFHNGDPLTTKDVKWTLEEAINQPWCARWVSNFKGVEILDDYNCVLKWSVGDANFMKYFAQCSMYIMPSDHIQKVGDNVYAEHPIGTGPFIFDSWVRGDRIVFKTNKEYFDRPAKYDTLIIRMIADNNSALMALESGNVDVVCDLKPSFKETVDQNENLRWEQTASSQFVYIQINNQVSPFSDVRVRKALNMAINREQLQAIALGGGGRMAPYGISPYSPQWKDSDPLPVYDVQAAKALLVEAGFPNGLDIALTCREGDYQKPASEIVQSNWAEIGVNCTVEVMEKNAQQDDLIAGNYQTGWQQTTDGILDGTIWAMANDSHYWGGNGANRAFYKNERFDELDALQKTELDPDKRMKYFDEMKKIYWEDCPNLPGFFAPITCAVNKNLKGTYAALANMLYRYEWFEW
jgi:peptide/nickel transport system substrate-binding protein